MPHVPWPGRHHLPRGLVVFETSEEVVRVNIKWRQFFGKKKVSSIADDQVDDLEEKSGVLEELLCWITHDANDGDDDPEGDGPLTCAILILCLRTGARLSVNCSEADDWGDAHVLVTTEEPQCESHHKGGDTAVRVGFWEEEDQGQLAEHDHEHEVSAEDAGKEGLINN